MDGNGDRPDGGDTHSIHAGHDMRLGGKHVHIHAVGDRYLRYAARKAATQSGRMRISGRTAEGSAEKLIDIQIYAANVSLGRGKTAFK